MPLGRVEAGQLRQLLREGVAHVAVQPLRARHLAELDLDLVGQVAALLRAGRVGRLEAMRGARMAGEALDAAVPAGVRHHLLAVFLGDGLQFRVARRHGRLAHRVRLEVELVAAGAGDGRPGLLGRALDVAVLADLARHLAVRRDLVVAHARHPEDHLHGLLRRVERVARVTADGVVLALEPVDDGVVAAVRALPDLAARHEDVAAVAEPLVVHHEVVRLHAGERGESDEHGGPGAHRGLDPTVPRAEPGEDGRAMAPQPPEDRQGDECRPGWRRSTSPTAASGRSTG